jgi:type II secretory pathway component PulF
VVLEVLGVLWVKHLASKATSPVGQFVKDKDKVAWQSLATTLENLSLCLAAGLNIGDALSKVSANAPPDVFEDLSVVVSKYELGAPMNITLQELGNAKARWRPITDALVGALVSGGPVQNHLEDLLNSLRITAEMENLKRIRGLSVRAVAPLGLCFLPAFMMLSIAPMVVGLFRSTVW